MMYTQEGVILGNVFGDDIHSCMARWQNKTRRGRAKCYPPPLRASPPRTPVTLCVIDLFCFLARVHLLMHTPCVFRPAPGMQQID